MRKQATKRDSAIERIKPEKMTTPSVRLARDNVAPLVREDGSASYVAHTVVIRRPDEQRGGRR